MDKYAILIGIAGGTGSGKTSIAKAIAADFGKSEVALIEQDFYYKDLSDLTIEERAIVNFDHPNSVDYALMKDHINIPDNMLITFLLLIDSFIKIFVDTFLT